MDMTLAEYARQMRDSFLSPPNAGISPAEYDKYYPAYSRLGYWLEDIETSAQRGQRLSAHVLDDLFVRAEWVFWALRRHYPSALPADYDNPRTRSSPEYQRFARAMGL